MGREQDRESAWALPAHCRLLSEALTSLGLRLPTWSTRTMDLIAVQASSSVCLGDGLPDSPGSSVFWGRFWAVLAPWVDKVLAAS